VVAPVSENEGLAAVRRLTARMATGKQRKDIPEVHPLDALHQ
jgi:hypothetical protein